MSNKEIIQRILEWEGPPVLEWEGPPVRRNNSEFLAPFWSQYRFKQEPGSLNTTTVVTNDHWFDGNYQLVLMRDRICVYDTSRTMKLGTYTKLTELALIPERDDLIAAVRMMAALGVNN